MTIAIAATTAVTATSETSGLPLPGEGAPTRTSIITTTSITAIEESVRITVIEAITTTTTHMRVTLEEGRTGVGPTADDEHSVNKDEEHYPPQRQRRQINKAVRGFKFYERTPNFVLQRYRAAGILPYATHDNRIFLLLGEEDRSSKGEKDKVWLNFGGKKEDEQDKGQPEATALREFAEETAGLFRPQMEALRMALQTNFADTLRMWNEKSRYVLYVVPMPYDPQVGDAFRRRREEEKESFRDTDHLRLQWVDAALLFAAKTEEGEDKEKVKETEEAARVVEELEETVYVEIDGERCKVHSFFMLLLRMPEVKRFLLETLPKRGIASSSSATEQQQSEGGEEEEEKEKEDEQEQRPEQEQGQEPQQQVHKKSRNRSKTRRRPKHKHSKSTDQPPPTRSTPIDQ
ncbi:hypothetical protein QOT17_008500 [Balamuthia mandrillaris]